MDQKILNLDYQTSDVKIINILFYNQSINILPSFNNIMISIDDINLLIKMSKIILAIKNNRINLKSHSIKFICKNRKIFNCNYSYLARRQLNENKYKILIKNFHLIDCYFNIKELYLNKIHIFCYAYNNNLFISPIFQMI